MPPERHYPELERKNARARRRRARALKGGKLAPRLLDREWADHARMAREARQTPIPEELESRPARPPRRGGSPPGFDLHAWAQHHA